MVSTDTTFTLPGYIRSPSQSIRNSVSPSNSRTEVLGSTWLYVARKRSQRCNYILFSCLSQQCHHVSSQTQTEKQEYSPFIPLWIQSPRTGEQKKDFKKKENSSTPELQTSNLSACNVSDEIQTLNINTLLQIRVKWSVSNKMWHEFKY